jgi:transposase
MHLHTQKQRQYFKKVIKLHYEKGYGEDRISRILPIGHSTVSRWLTIFAAENDKSKVPMHNSEAQSQPSVSGSQEKDATTLQAEVARLQVQLKHERMRAEAYAEMIRVAESKFNIAIRKKAGAKR